MARVAVVGSANLDIVMAVQRIPAPGETVLGDRLDEVAGGKGLNQAIAAARHQPVSFVGCLGDDAAAQLLESALTRAGVDVSHVQRSDQPTGRAFIPVAADGENSIVVLALANRDLDPSHVIAALEHIGPDLVLTQLEIPLEVVMEVADWTETRGVRFVLNPSPVAGLPRSLLARCDPLIVNAVEGTALLDAAGERGTSTPEQAAVALARLTRSVVVTDGSRGAWVGQGTRIDHAPVGAVAARDTTGAGDELAGVLAAHLAAGVALPDAAALANEAAAALVQVARAERQAVWERGEPDPPASS